MIRRMPSRLNRKVLRFCGAVCGSMLAVLLMTGCRHKPQPVVSRSPPPLAAPQKSTDTTTARHVPVVPVPLVAADDNAVPSSRVASMIVGLASWYGPPYNNRAGANGKIYDQNALTAAHRTLPMGTVLQVTNLTTNQAVTVAIADRGPFVHGRILDLSMGAAKAAGVYRMGVAQVSITIITPGANAAVPGKWCVQTGAFLDHANALHLQTELQHSYGAAARVLQFQGPTGYWVRIDPAGGSRAQATQIANSIHAAEPGALPYLVRLD